MVSRPSSTPPRVRRGHADADDVVARARSGDGPAWDQLVADHAGDIRAFARRRGVVDADDLVQDVFLAAAARIGSFDGSASQFRSWLFTVAHRRVADVHRARYRSKTDLTDELDVDDTAPSIEDRVLDGEAVSEALMALSVLDERERQVLLMRVIDETPSAQVASELGLSAVNARVIQSRALTKVRRELERRSRNTAGLPAIALGAMALSDRMSALTGRLPRDAQLASWISEVRADAVAHLGPGATAADVAALVELAATPSAVAGGADRAGADGSEPGPADGAPSPGLSQPVTAVGDRGVAAAGSVPSAAPPVGTVAAGPSASAAVAAAAAAGSSVAAPLIVAAVSTAIAVGVGAVVAAQLTADDDHAPSATTTPIGAVLTVEVPPTSLRLDLDRLPPITADVSTSPVDGLVKKLEGAGIDESLTPVVGSLPVDSVPHISTVDRAVPDLGHVAPTVTVQAMAGVAETTVPLPDP